MLLIPNETFIQYVTYLNKRGILAAHQGQYNTIQGGWGQVLKYHFLWLWRSKTNFSRPDPKPQGCYDFHFLKIEVFLHQSDKAERNVDSISRSCQGSKGPRCINDLPKGLAPPQSACLLTICIHFMLFLAQRVAAWPARRFLAASASTPLLGIASINLQW